MSNINTIPRGRPRKGISSNLTPKRLKLDNIPHDTISKDIEMIDISDNCEERLLNHSNKTKEPTNMD